MDTSLCHLFLIAVTVTYPIRQQKTLFNTDEFFWLAIISALPWINQCLLILVKSKFYWHVTKLQIIDWHKFGHSKVSADNSTRKVLMGALLTVNWPQLRKNLCIIKDYDLFLWINQIFDIRISIIWNGSDLEYFVPKLVSEVVGRCSCLFTNCSDVVGRHEYMYVVGFFVVIKWKRTLLYIFWIKHIRTQFWWKLHENWPFIKKVLRVLIFDRMILERGCE